ncbi:unnamed protein product [Tetraodon nigroviridis]|uniref:(spotted green pufferfish) hypothetical protein n=1 Tax=Tetraodon nigroviridis TaxID=99883 RepID=Q4SBL8_TETNG|nr:unnamed protein product [Tetraodon nigroviridis]
MNHNMETPQAPDWWRGRESGRSRAIGEGRGFERFSRFSRWSPHGRTATALKVAARVGPAHRRHTCTLARGHLSTWKRKLSCAAVQEDKPTSRTPQGH